MEITNKIYLLRRVNWIKSFFLSLKFKSKILVGYGCKININRGGLIKVKKGGRFLFGVGISLPAKTVLDIYRNGVLEIEGDVNINKGCKIMIGENAVFKIGNKSYINEHSRVQCRKKIEIGEQCAIAWNVDILDTDEHRIIEGDHQINAHRPVKIGNHVWIGLKTTILKGTIIEDNCIIGASSLISGTYDKNCLYVGVPAQKIRENINWEK